MKLLKIGELAKAAGITVRSLHHYDRIGLLQPTTARESGHRLYNQKDVERLQQIISLKSMGLSLDAIAQCLDEGAYDLRKTLSMQEVAISNGIENLQRVQRTLRLMIDKLALDQDLTTKELLSFIKEVQKMENYYTPEQLKALKDRMEKYPEKAKEVEKAWPILFKKFEDAMKAGLSESDLKVQVLAKEAEHYIDLFTGGDKAIEANMNKFYEENPEKRSTMWGVTPEVANYVDRAMKNLKKIKKG